MRFLLTSVLLIYSQLSFGQFKRMEFGVKGGLNVSSLALSQEGKLVSTAYHAAVNYHFGGYAILKISKLALQPEILFSKQGQNFTTPYNSNLNTSISYINIPILAKYYLAGSLNLQAGPQIGIVAGSKGDLVNEGFSQSLNASGQNLKSYINPVDFSFVFGAGVDLPFKMNLTIRYVLGISDVNKNTLLSTPIPGGAEPSFSTSYTRNQVIQISLGYRLKKVGK